MRFALVLFLLRGAHATVRKGFTIDGLPSQVDVVIHDGPTSCEADERVAKDDHVEMFYTGTIDASSETGTAGMQFDSNVGKSAFPFYVGEHSVIEGLDQGIVGLCVGSKAVFTIPPDMGYAERGAGSIPGGATLKFDVEVVSIGPTRLECVGESQNWATCRHPADLRHVNVLALAGTVLLLPSGSLASSRAA